MALHPGGFAGKMKLGLLAGNRNFPLLCARQITYNHPEIELVVFAIKGETNPLIKKFCPKTIWVSAFGLQTIIDEFKKNQIDKAVMAGQISPIRIFKDKNKWDARLKKVVSGIEDFRPHSVFRAIIEEMAGEGIHFENSVAYLQDYLAKRGLNNSFAVQAESVKKDIELGVNIAEDLVNFDIGQTIVVKDKAIVAVEALEGTDRTMKRGFSLCGRGFTVVKFSRKNQDLRFDVPVVGLKTISVLGKLRAKALVLEAGRVLILDKEKFLKLADKFQISVFGYSRDN